MLGVIVDQAQSRCGVQSVLRGFRVLAGRGLSHRFTRQAALQAWRPTGRGADGGQPLAVALRVQVDPDTCPPQALWAFGLAYAFEQPRFATGCRLVLWQRQIGPGQVDVIVGDDPALQLGR